MWKKIKCYLGFHEYVDDTQADTIFSTGSGIDDKGCSFSIKTEEPVVFIRPYSIRLWGKTITFCKHCGALHLNVKEEQ